MDNLNDPLNQQPTSNYQPGGPVEVVKPGKIGKIILTVIIVLVSLLLVSGASAYVYFTKIAPVSVEKIMANIENVKTVKFQVKTNVDLTPNPVDNTSTIELGIAAGPDLTSGLAPKEPASGEVNIQGVSDVTNQDKPQGEMLLSLLAKTKAETKNYEMEIKYKDKVNYFKISSLPDLGFFDLSFLTNRWIKIDTSSSSAETGGIAALFSQIESLQADLLAKNQAEIEKQKAEFKDLLAKNPVLNITDKFLPTRLNGKLVYHVGYKFNEENLRLILRNLYGFDETVSSTIESSSFAEMLRAAEEKKVEKYVATAKNISGEIWLGVFDLLPYQITFNLNSENQPGYQKLVVNGVMNFSNYNEPVSITLPESSTSIDQLMQEFMNQMFGAAMGTSTESDLPTSTLGLEPGNHINIGDSPVLNDNTDILLTGKAANLDTDGDGLPDAIEKEIGTDPNNPDTDGDGYSDNVEFTTGHDPLHK